MTSIVQPDPPISQTARTRYRARLSRPLLRFCLAALWVMGLGSQGHATALKSLFSFTGPQNGTHAQAALIQISGGNLYGTTFDGGPYNAGTIFKITSGGALTTLYSFSAQSGAGTNPDGANPEAALIQGSDGNLYGTCVNGGAHGSGTLFEITPGGVFTTLYSFSALHSGYPYTNPDGAHPQAALMQGSDGNLYGACAGGGKNGVGTLFKITTGGVFTRLYAFSALINGVNSDGAQPAAALLQANDGNLYGTCVNGGANGSGTLFKITTGGVFTTLYSFSARSGSGTNSDGADPAAALIQATDSNLYGTCRYGGANGSGTLFKITTGGAFALLHAFNVSDGAHPQAALMQGSDGNLYGTCVNGGTNGSGALFKITTGGAFTTLYSFSAQSGSGTNSDGADPAAALIQATDSNLYGTCRYGGVNGVGTLFKITPSGSMTTLSTLVGPSDGIYPHSSLIQASNGYFYGATGSGGLLDDGTLYVAAPDGTVTTLYTFSGLDGANPSAALMQGSDGNLYGTCANGGAHGSGTIFTITTGGVFTTLYSFSALSNSDNSDGANPSAALIQGSDGNLYGTCANGGAHGFGTLFKITTGGTFSTLHSFNGSDGFYPQAGLVQANDGNLYGTCFSGGANGSGTLFRITTGGAFTVLYAFSALRGTNPDGAHPQAALMQAGDGNLYGTCEIGGANGYGTLFKITPGGAFTTLYSFSAESSAGANADGANPSAALLQANDGNLYGTCVNGGVNGSGTLFKITPGGVFTTLYSFSALSGGANPDGANPQAALLQAGGGSLFGICKNGGEYGSGTFFKFGGHSSHAKFDVDGDGTSDILFRNSEFGASYIWEMSGFNILNQGYVNQTVPPVWQIAGTGDFNADGKSGILWRNALTGDVYLWEMNGFSILSQGFVTQGLPRAWQVAGVGDFDGDGTDDILWVNTQTGNVVVWFMNGLNITGQGLVAVGIPGVWQVAGVGDFDGDGMADILWRNTQTGDVVVWLMNGSTIVNQGLVASGIPGVWQISGIGDFNGDGKSDILWYNTQTGNVVVWLMSGTAILGQTLVASGVQSPWQIAGVGDFNGDGTDDILWYNAQAGEVYLWEINAGAILAQGYIGQIVPQIWKIVAP